MQKVILNIKGMSCSACSNSLEKYLNKQNGIINATVNLVLSQASIEYNDNLSIEDLNKFISDAGFESLGIYDETKINKTNKSNKIIIPITFLTILVLYISMSHMLSLPSIPYLDMMKNPINYTISLLILTIPYLIYGFDIIKNGYKNLIHAHPNMDTLVFIGVLSSLIYSIYNTILLLKGNTSLVDSLYYESCIVVIYFIKLGRQIETKNKEKTLDAIKELVTITPSYALLKVGNEVKEVTIDEIKENDILVCKPGMKLAVDGIITNGTTHIDESFITGESIPSKKEKGNKVIAGSLNIDGYIEYKAEKIGKNSTISEIVRLVVEATNTKSPISKLADKVSGIFVPLVMLIATITLISYLLLGYNLNISLTRFVTVLVISCPCALGLATPLAVVVAMGITARNGILIKTSEVLEAINKVDTIVFDKTGTLTYGNLKISKLCNYSNYNNSKLLNIVSSIESKSNHPIASAFKTNDKLQKVTSFKNIDGIGLKGVINNKEYYVGNNKLIKKLKINNTHSKDELDLVNNGNSIIYVIEDNNIIALIGVKDIIRKEAKEVIKKLNNMNKNVIMLTGDNEITAQVIAKELGIKEVIANVLPKEKSEKIKELMNNNKYVMMVGDGINDAVSLVTANIGVALSSGTDIANNSADVILMNNNLINIINMFHISKKTITNIKQNLFLAFFYNICMIPLAIGLLSKWNINMNPMLGSIAMTLSSITVVLNALRLKNIKLEGGNNNV
ncbi:MAG: cadmium-translocating P-type ATPase [Bacilli bacterium]|nr:cadmium-translocating P-type ATPase [Bacilli bacterium]